MELVQRSIAGRAFLLQFFQIMSEFGHVIPWLDPVHSISYTTNGVAFRDQFLQGLRCSDESLVTAFQLVDSDRPREYLGGALHLSFSPECFRDLRNQEVNEQLSEEGYHYLTCLQIREPHRGGRCGRELSRRVIRLLLNRYGKVWGVVSNPRQAGWYQSIGGTVRSPRDNRDNLWIISFDQMIPGLRGELIT